MNLNWNTVWDFADTCHTVRIEIIVLDLVPDTTCPCVQNCVWPGDANSDGKVNVQDLLPLGWHMGTNGPARPEAEATEWYGQHCENWSEDLTENGANIKHVDTDGDGILLASDTTKILEHYYQVHTVIPEEDHDIKAYPFELIIETPEVEQGDLARISISTGSDQYPMFDYHGLSFSIDYNVNVVDSGSMRCRDILDNWLTIDGPSMFLDVIPFDGRIDAAITRTDGVASSGNGKIVELLFIIGEEDLDGFQSETLDYYTREFTIGDIYAQRADGSIVRIPGSTVELKIKKPTLEREEENQNVTADQLLIFPNPSSSNVTVHLNGKQVISTVDLVNQQGISVRTWESLDAERLSFSTEAFSIWIVLPSE